ncbi:MAG TPA: SIS domain-containing protein [Candidatus Xenobia bacterium]
MVAARTIHMITGLNAWAWPSSEILLCPRPPYDRRIKTLQIYVSRSGETTETLWALQRLQQIDPKANMLAITTNPQGSLGRMTTRTILLDHAAEQGIVATRSVAASTLAGQMLAAWLLPDDRLVNDLRGIPHAINLNERKVDLQKIAGAKPVHTIMAGHGPMTGVAHEAAMKFKQLAGTSAEVLLPLEMRHGLWAAIKPDTMSFFFQTETLKGLEDEIIWECAKMTGPRCAFTEVASTQLKSGTDHVVELKSGLSECARAVPMMSFMQLLAFYLSIARGANPDKPRHSVAPVRVHVPTG